MQPNQHRRPGEDRSADGDDEHITINALTLTPPQALTVRIALDTFDARKEP